MEESSPVLLSELQDVLPETSVSMSIPELIIAVTEKTSLAKEEVEKVVYAFIEYHLKRFKLK